MRTPAKTLPRAARTGGHRAVAGKLLGFVIVGLTDGEDDGAPRRAFAMAALSTARPGFRPTRNHP